MIKTRIATMAAVAALTVASIGLTSPANAVPTKAGAGCSQPIKAKETLKIRKTSKISSTAVGLFPKGAKTCFTYAEDGQKFHFCGKTSEMWEYITYRGMKGFVPETCTSLI